jgi:hypothetical protein
LLNRAKEIFMKKMLSRQIGNIIIILIVLISVSCNAMEESASGVDRSTSSSEKVVEVEELGELQIKLLGRDSYRAFVGSSLFDNAAKVRLDTENEATLFCNDKSTRYRLIKWAKQSNGYQLEFRCL